VQRVGEDLLERIGATLGIGAGEEVFADGVAVDLACGFPIRQQFGFDVGGKDASQFVALQRSEAALECPGLGEVVLHKTGIAVAMSRLGPRLGAVLIGQFDPIGHAPFKNFSGRSHHLRKRGCSSMNLSRTLGFANPRANTPA